MVIQSRRHGKPSLWMTALLRMTGTGERVRPERVYRMPPLRNTAPGLSAIEFEKEPKP